MKKYQCLNHCNIYLFLIKNKSILKILIRFNRKDLSFWLILEKERDKIGNFGDGCPDSKAHHIYRSFCPFWVQACIFLANSRNVRSLRSYYYTNLSSYVTSHFQHLPLPLYKCLIHVHLISFIFIRSRCVLYEKQSPLGKIFKEIPVFFFSL